MNIIRKAKSALGHGQQHRPLLTKALDKEWRKIFVQYLARARGTMFSGETREMKAHAAALAWITVKQMGAKTIIGQYGNTKVDILTDTRQLLNSLTFGSHGKGSEYLILTPGPGYVIVGTNRPGAIIHHEGRGHVPQRRLWPEPAKWPTAWWDLLLDAGQRTMVTFLKWFLGQRV